LLGLPPHLPVSLLTAKQDIFGSYFLLFLFLFLQSGWLFHFCQIFSEISCQYISSARCILLHFNILHFCIFNVSYFTFSLVLSDPEFIPSLLSIYSFFLSFLFLPLLSLPCISSFFHFLVSSFSLSSLFFLSLSSLFCLSLSSLFFLPLSSLFFLSLSSLFLVSFFSLYCLSSFPCLFLSSSLSDFEK
jgi:hypothetical protein